MKMITPRMDKIIPRGLPAATQNPIETKLATVKNAKRKKTKFMI